MPHIVQLLAPAKINLNLFITGVRQDGFHELDTLFLKLSAPSDTLHIEPGPAKSGLDLHCPVPGLAVEQNIIYKAWTLFSQATGHSPNWRVRVDKRIPQGMGLGGGSADAGIFLRHLNAWAGKNALSHAELLSLAARLGADVPFFVLDAKAARGRGIGERLTPCSPDLRGLHLVLACPQVHVDTAWAYAEWDRRHPNLPALTSGELGTKSAAPETGLVLHNDFEEVVFAAFPVLREIKECLLRAGAAGAAMTGSGAGIFGLFRSLPSKKRAEEKLRKQNIPFYAQSF